MCVLVTQSYPTLCNSMDSRPPGSSDHGILQARILEWIAISLSRASSQPRDWTCVSCIGKWILYHWATREACDYWLIWQAIIFVLNIIIFVVQSLSHVWLFATPWTAARQASLSFTFSWNLLKLMLTESVMPSNHLILGCPLLLLPSIFPSIRSFPMSRLFASVGHTIGASALVLPMNIQD